MMTRMQPTGEQHEITSAGYRAVVTEVGANLRVLTHDGRDLVTPFAADEMRPVHRGALLAPWPNRVGDGAYSFAGSQHQLSLNEVPRHNAVHGLVGDAPWLLVEGDGVSVVLVHRLWPSKGYPFALDLEVRYALDDDGLTTTLRATNVGDTAAPYGCAPHTYLVAGPGRVDDWTAQVPAGMRLEVDADRLLPADPPRLVDVAGTPWDLREPALLGDRQLDDALTGLVPVGGRVVVRVQAGDGSGVEMAWDPAVLPWVQVHTADRPEPALDRAGLAVEPMTCPPDAFRSGVDLVVLEPGATHEATWTLRAVTRSR